jgi:lipoprotein-anchoring transpeptidase ErfK/SrfK
MMRLTTWLCGRRFLVALVALVLIAASCTSATTDVADDPARSEPPGATASPEPQPTPDSTATPDATPVPTPTPALTLGLPDVDEALDVAPAPLGTYAVARPGAGILRAPQVGLANWPEIPVYDWPFGEPRTLLDVNDIDARQQPVPLLNTSGPGGALVLRVLAGGADDQWLLVQVPTRPNNSYAWVRSSHFDLGFTNRRIEVDLAGPGKLTVFENAEPIMTAPIVQGRDARPSVRTIGFIENGVPGKRLSPAYGLAVIRMAVFSEALGTFGGGLPHSFLHGTNQPELMGQRVSSGEIRVANDTLESLIDVVSPGTPVIMFDSVQGETRAAVAGRSATPAATMPFLEAGPGTPDHTVGLVPQTWRRCGSNDDVPSEQLLCRSDTNVAYIQPGRGFGPDEEHVFAVARQDAKACTVRGDFDFDTAGPPQPKDCVVTVFDEPFSLRPRTLIYRNEIDNVDLVFPLYRQTVFGEPLVLSVVEMTADGQWLRVRAPVLPHNRTVWVKGDEFTLQSSMVRVEVDLAHDEGDGLVGRMWVYDGDREVLTTSISSGRESRPTTTTSTYVDQVLVGTDLSEAYGPRLFSTPTYSEALGTFGGGIPTQAIHGIQDELWESHEGVPMSSGSIHIAQEAAIAMHDAVDLLGARVVIYDSSQSGSSLSTVQQRSLVPAETTEQPANWDPPIPSYT